MIPLFAGHATFQIRFQPFQLDPSMPSTCKKSEYFGKMFGGKGWQREKLAELQSKWAVDGLKLTSPAGLNGGGWGNTFNAQRLIWWARQQGREDAMIERVYEANHEHNKSLGDIEVLLEAAQAAGVQGAREMLSAGHGVQEVLERIAHYVTLGITAVPSIIVDETWLISTGAPEKDFLAGAFHELITAGKLPWPPLQRQDEPEKRKEIKA